MAARPVLLGLASARTRLLNSAVRVAPRRAFNLSVAKLAPTVATSTPSTSNPIITPAPASALPAEDAANETKHAAFLGEADSNDGHEAFKDAYGAPTPALDAQNSAFLGEADSNDGHEAFKDAYGAPTPALDAQNSAFLGEADSDDAFEAQRAAEGDKREPLDASNSAYLGEADSDDGFESDIEIHPEDHRHKIEDTSDSGIHGQSGELDQRIE